MPQHPFGSRKETSVVQSTERNPLSGVAKGCSIGLSAYSLWELAPSDITLWNL